MCYSYFVQNYFSIAKQSCTKQICKNQFFKEIVIFFTRHSRFSLTLQYNNFWQQFPLLANFTIKAFALSSTKPLKKILQKNDFIV